MFLAQRAAEEQEAQEKESRALFHVHMRAMDIARLEDRRAERQMLESTSRQPVRGAGVTFGAPPGEEAVGLRSDPAVYVLTRGVHVCA